MKLVSIIYSVLLIIINIKKVKGSAHGRQCRHGGQENSSPDIRPGKLNKTLILSRLDVKPS